MKCERCNRELDADEIVMSVPGGFQHLDCGYYVTNLRTMKTIPLDPNWKFSYKWKSVYNILDADVIE